MKKSNPRKYDVAGLGNWGISEGLVYENWTVGKKEIQKDELYKWKSFFGLDYGYTNDPTGFVGFMANPIDKELYIFCEFCKKRKRSIFFVSKKTSNSGFPNFRIAKKTSAEATAQPIMETASPPKVPNIIPIRISTGSPGIKEMTTCRI